MSTNPKRMLATYRCLRAKPGHVILPVESLPPTSHLRICKPGTPIVSKRERSKAFDRGGGGRHQKMDETTPTSGPPGRSVGSWPGRP